jgi:hypothetical protein
MIKKLILQKKNKTKLQANNREGKTFRQRKKLLKETDHPTVLLSTLTSLKHLIISSW